MFDLAPYVESWMDRLGKERPLFHSESDFQLALATVMADEVEQVRLEKKVAVSERVGGRPRLAVDVLGRLGGRHIALELKHRRSVCWRRPTVRCSSFLLRGLRILIRQPSGGTLNALNG